MQRFSFSTIILLWIARKLTILAVILCLASTMYAAPKHTYDHVATLHFYQTGRMHGEGVTHADLGNSSYTCVNVYDRISCEKDELILMVKWDDGQDEIPVAEKGIMHDVIRTAILPGANVQELLHDGVHFVYRTEGGKKYVPKGWVDKNGEAHFKGEDAYLF